MLLTYTGRPVLGDGCTGMLGLEKGLASLVLSDLPSGETQAEFDKTPDLPKLWAGIWHCLKEDGIAVLMASSFRFADLLFNSQKEHFRYDLVWHKSLASGFLNAARAPLRAHEFILVFSRVPGIYTPQMSQGASPIHAARRISLSENYGDQSGVSCARKGATDRYPVSVLEFGSLGTSSPNRIHPQQKPVPLLRWLIRTYSRPGELVVDPCAGSGSTGVAATEEGRSFVGWDISSRFGGVAEPVKDAPRDVISLLSELLTGPQVVR